LIAGLARDGNGKFYWKFNLQGLLQSCDNISNFSVEGVYGGSALFLGGSRSTYITPSDHQRIFESFPHAKVVMLDAGHWVHADQPQQTYKEVSRFLSEE
jgi:esterase